MYQDMDGLRRNMSDGDWFNLACIWWKTQIRWNMQSENETG